MTSLGLAEASNMAVYATMVVLTFAMIAFAVAIAAIGGTWLFLSRSYLGTAIRAISQDRGIMPLMGVDPGAFWSQMQAGVDVWNDIVNGVIKSIVFGFAVTFIALFQGYEAQPTPEGVARATTRTVVIGSLTVLWLDFLLTALMFTQ